jgi:hypothetical protein
MVTLGTKRLTNMAGWRNELTIPDPSTYKWEDGVKRICHPGIEKLKSVGSSLSIAGHSISQ